MLLPYKITHSKVSQNVKDGAAELMDQVNISEVNNFKATEVSGGQAQRTAIARALINNSKLILAVEFTGNWNLDNTTKIYNLLRSVNKSYKTTFAVITYNQEVANKTGRIIEIKDGRVLKVFLT